jgi:hypothetical protein
MDTIYGIFKRSPGRPEEPRLPPPDPEPLPTPVPDPGPLPLPA